MKLNWRKEKRSIHDTLFQFFHQFPNIIPKYRSSNASKPSHQTCHKKKKNASQWSRHKETLTALARDTSIIGKIWYIFFLSLSFSLFQRYSPQPESPFFWRGERSERNRSAVKSNRKWRVACDKAGDAGGKRDAFCFSQSDPPRCTAETIPPVSSLEHGDGMERNLLQPPRPRRHGKLDFFLEWSDSLSRQLRSMRFSCLSTRLQSGYSQGSPSRCANEIPVNLVHHLASILEGRGGGQWTSYGMVSMVVSGLWVTFTAF